MCSVTTLRRIVDFLESSPWSVGAIFPAPRAAISTRLYRVLTSGNSMVSDPFPPVKRGGVGRSSSHPNGMSGSASSRIFEAPRPVVAASRCFVARPESPQRGGETPDKDAFVAPTGHFGSVSPPRSLLIVVASVVSSTGATKPHTSTTSTSTPSSRSSTTTTPGSRRRRRSRAVPAGRPGGRRSRLWICARPAASSSASKHDAVGHCTVLEIGDSLGNDLGWGISRHLSARQASTSCRWISPRRGSRTCGSTAGRFTSPLT